MLRVVKVTYDNNDTVTTSMSASLTDQDIHEYFKVGKTFNIGTVQDVCVKVKAVEIIA